MTPPVNAQFKNPRLVCLFSIIVCPVSGHFLPPPETGAKMVGKPRPGRRPAGNVRTLFPIEHKISLTGKVRSRYISVKQIVLLAAKRPARLPDPFFPTRYRLATHRSFAAEMNRPGDRYLSPERPAPRLRARVVVGLPGNGQANHRNSDQECTNMDKKKPFVIIFTCAGGEELVSYC